VAPLYRVAGAGEIARRRKLVGPGHVRQFGVRTVYEPAGPTDPILCLRRPGGTAAHLWRFFRSKRGAGVYLTEYYGPDSKGREWAATLPAETIEELLDRHAVRE